MLICPGCHATVDETEAWMMCPECGFAFEDDDTQPTMPVANAIVDEPQTKPQRPQPVATSPTSPVHPRQQTPIVQRPPPAPAPPQRSQPPQRAQTPALPADDLVYPSEMTEDDLRDYEDEQESAELPVHARHDSMFREVRAVIAQRDSAPPQQPARQNTPAPVPQDKLRQVRSMNIDPRAKKLVEAAEKDRARGEFGSALNNLKLAMTYEPNHPELRAVLEELAKDAPAARPGSKVAPQKSLLARAIDAEKLGEIDQAIEMLEKHLASHTKDAAAFNRLGIILAMQGKDLARGREMIEKALTLDPENPNYAQNLSKVLTRAATNDLKKKPAADNKRPGSMLGLFGKKK